ncbi:cytochrome PufQ [Salibaculum halophilum]|uniref:cytochrome PufQ n=1 Tax=Salibaculum halophilum TaxID=1914408 RepID=UPI000A1002A0|nr:cytochrome PufQ [Salibaculum halophilum]
MTDISSHVPPRARCGRPRSAEFHVYFTLIFVCALPFASLRWAREVARHRTLNLRGPLARAWAEADRMTPMIFSA